MVGSLGAVTLTVYVDGVLLIDVIEVTAVCVQIQVSPCTPSNIRFDAAFHPATLVLEMLPAGNVKTPSDVIVVIGNSPLERVLMSAYVFVFVYDLSAVFGKRAITLRPTNSLPVLYRDNSLQPE